MRKHWAVVAALVVCLVGPSMSNAQSDQRDQAVADAIGRAIEVLWSSQDGARGTWPSFSGSSEYSYADGPTALVVYALLEGGVPATDERLVAALRALEEARLTTTYELSLRANVWQAANAQTEGKYAKQLRRDIEALGRLARGGAFGYSPKGGDWDNSNSQFGAFGVLAGARGDVRVSLKFWKNVTSHWVKCQGHDGSWSYRAGAGGRRRYGYLGDYYSQRPQATMTAAGLATLLLCMDFMETPRSMIQCRDVQLPKAIVGATQWLDDNLQDAIDSPDSGTRIWRYYLLYTLSRAALAGGTQYFGEVDWRQRGTDVVLWEQQHDGSWPGKDQFDANRSSASVSIANTAFALLFLVNAQRPTLFGELEFNGDWHNRLRDLARVTDYVGQSSGRKLRWRIVRLDKDPAGWKDVPILLVSGCQALPFRSEPIRASDRAPQRARIPEDLTPENVAKIQKYAYDGGVILSVTENNGEDFQQSIRQLYAKAFPGNELIECPPDHPLYTIKHQLAAGKPTFFVIADGDRPLAIHTDADLTLGWQMGPGGRNQWAFDAAENIAAYVERFSPEESPEEPPPPAEGDTQDTDIPEGL